MSKPLIIWPEEGEREARQPDQPLMRFPDGSLRELTRKQRGLSWDHQYFGHRDTLPDCLSCLWENAI